MKYNMITPLAVAFALMLGCNKDKGADTPEAAEETEEAAEDTEDALDDAADDVEDAVDEAGDEVDGDPTTD